MGWNEYSITFISKKEGASEQTIVVVEPWLIQQLQILMESYYQIIKVKLIKE